MKTITTAVPHGYAQGDTVTISTHRPWWLRLWRWITRQKDPVLEVTEVTRTTFTMR